MEERSFGEGREPISDLVGPRRVFKRKRRSGLILAMKIVLPVVAVACVGYIGYWSQQVPVVHPIEVVGDQQQKKASDVTVSQVKYDGLDARNRPYSITAASATQPQTETAANSPNAQPAQGGNVINLKKLLADMTMENGAWVAVEADNGIYHRDAGTVDLSGNVTLFHDTGLTFETDAAVVDLKNDTARGDQPIEGQNPDGVLTAQGFEVRDDGQTIVFTGRAYMKLYPKNAQRAGDGS
jgi:lipopolysaccharide export system protein LptC